MTKARLAIVTTHPIQYYAPIFRLLSENEQLEIMVFYTWGNVGEQKFDPGFGKAVKWDIPLLEGYPFKFVKNTARKPGSSHFWGIQNPTLYSEIIAWKPSAVLVFGWSYFSHLSILYKLKGKIPVYFRGDSNLMDKQKSAKAVARDFVLKLIYKLVNKAFYVGTQNKMYFEKYGLRSSQLIFAPHAIDNYRFSQIDDEKRAFIDNWKKEIGIPNQAITIIFVGKFEPKKNPLLLFKAFKIINNPNLHLLFVGNGILEEAMKLQANGSENIHFLPFQNQSFMPLVYRLGDIFCLPSQGPGETWGLAINEAMACGLPILASDKCGASIDLISEGKNGFSFKSNDENDLVQKINTLLLSDLKEMGEISSEKIKNWSFEHIVSAIVTELKQ